MRLLNARVHGILDYVVVAFFLAAPRLLGLGGLPATMAYGLAGIHLLLTLATAFPPGVIKLVPLPVHGGIELAVSLALPTLPWLLGFAADPAARNLYVGAGAGIFVTWLITDYRPPGAA